MKTSSQIWKKFIKFDKDYANLKKKTFMEIKIKNIKKNKKIKRQENMKKKHTKTGNKWTPKNKGKSGPEKNRQKPHCPTVLSVLTRSVMGVRAPYALAFYFAPEAPNM